MTIWCKGFPALDAGIVECAVEHLAGRPDEGFARDVFLVARLLADEHEPRVLRPFAEDDLRRVFVEIAGAAMRGLARHLFEAFACGKKIGSGHGNTSKPSCFENAGSSQNAHAKKGLD